MKWTNITLLFVLIQWIIGVIISLYSELKHHNISKFLYRTNGFIFIIALPISTFFVFPYITFKIIKRTIRTILRLTNNEQ